MKKLILLSLVVSLSACSFPDAKKDEPAVRADDLEFAVDTFESPAQADPISVEAEKIAETTIPDEYQAPPVEEPAMITPQEPSFEEFTKPEVAKTEPQPVEVPQEIVIAPSMPAQREVAMTGNYERYEVQKGDTMMLVAFKIYGDYRKWKELAGWNKEVANSKLVKGTILKYAVPEEKFGWMPSGLPYLVKTGDTLQVISMDKYGTTRKWKSIYENNRPLIRNPNLIFAGFTLYYQPVRDLASQPR